MSMRDEILSRVKEAVSKSGPEKSRKDAVKKRLKAISVGTVPYGRKSEKEILSLFEEKLSAASASFDICRKAEVSEKLAAFLRTHNLPAACRIGDNKRLGDLLKRNNKIAEITCGPSDGNDITSVSEAVSAFAETGTLVLESGPANPTSLNFLAENHVVVLNRSTLKLHQEETWAELRKKHGNRNLPRTINLVTGPSRSADIEQTLILGAHGPIRLHVIVVEDN